MYKIPFVYGEEVRIPFIYLDERRIPMGIRPFTEKRQLIDNEDLTMYLIHGKLAFGLDRFMLGQIDPLTLGTIDPFPLDVK